MHMWKCSSINLKISFLFYFMQLKWISSKDKLSTFIAPQHFGLSRSEEEAKAKVNQRQFKNPTVYGGWRHKSENKKRFS